MTECSLPNKFDKMRWFHGKSNKWSKLWSPFKNANGVNRSQREVTFTSLAGQIVPKSIVPKWFRFLFAAATLEVERPVTENKFQNAKTTQILKYNVFNTIVLRSIFNFKLILYRTIYSITETKHIQVFSRPVVTCLNVITCINIL